MSFLFEHTETLVYDVANILWGLPGECGGHTIDDTTVLVEASYKPEVQSDRFDPGDDEEIEIERVFLKNSVTGHTLEVEVTSGLKDRLAELAWDAHQDLLGREQADRETLEDAKQEEREIER